MYACPLEPLTLPCQCAGPPINYHAADTGRCENLTLVGARGLTRVGARNLALVGAS